VYVKRYFLSLAPTELEALLDDYERRYGHEARSGTERILPHWRSGTITMSGRMVGRLYRLLPPRMPVDARYELAERLWRHVSPASRGTFRVGPDASTEEVLSAVAAHMDAVITGHAIPEELQRRFTWLAAADVRVKQEILNRGFELEKSLVLDAARTHLPVVLRHMRSDVGERTMRFCQELKVGKHRLELLVDRDASGVKVDDPGGRAGDRWRRVGLALRSLRGAVVGDV